MSQQELERPGYLTLYNPRRSSLAFIVEALVLLVFLIASLAVIMQVFAASANKATESRQLEQAVILASNAAERFSADPTGIEETTMVDGLALTCKVSETALAQGTRYEASITVFSENGEIYRLNTARYVPRTFTGVTADNAAGNTAAGATAEQPNAQPGAQASGQDTATNANSAGAGQTGASASADAPVEEVIE